MAFLLMLPTHLTRLRIYCLSGYCQLFHVSSKYLLYNVKYILHRHHLNIHVLKQILPVFFCDKHFFIPAFFAASIFATTPPTGLTFPL